MGRSSHDAVSLKGLRCVNCLVCRGFAYCASASVDAVAMNEVRRFAVWALVFGYVLLCSPVSRAESMAPLPYIVGPWHLNWDGTAWDGPPAVGIAACAALTASMGIPSNTCSASNWPVGTDHMRCVCSQLGQQNYGSVSCGAGFTTNASQPYCRKTGVGCPLDQGWTLDGGQCVRPDCDPSVTRNPDGSCPAPACAVGEATSGARYTGRFNGGNGVAVGTHSPVPPTLCDGQCVFTPGAATACSSGPGVGSPIQCEYVGTKTGAHCSGGNGDAPAYDPCVLQGGVAGTLNGQVVCNGKAADGAVPGEVSSTKTTTTPTSTTTTTSTTSCDGEQCSTTTSSTTTSGGSGPNGTGPGSTTSANPPGTPPDGTVDQEQVTFCEENPENLLCKGLGPVGEAGEIATQSQSVASFQAVSVSTSGSCPGPVALPRGLGHFSWTPICEGMGLIRPVVLALAWLGAGIIVFGGYRGGV